MKTTAPFLNLPTHKKFTFKQTMTLLLCLRVSQRAAVFFCMLCCFRCIHNGGNSHRYASNFGCSSYHLHAQQMDVRQTGTTMATVAHMHEEEEQSVT